MDYATLCRRVHAVRTAAHDPESAHALEDRLHRDVLRAIALKQVPAAEASDWAITALVTEDIEFDRCCS